MIYYKTVSLIGELNFYEKKLLVVVRVVVVALRRCLFNTYSVNTYFDLLVVGSAAKKLIKKV